MSIPKIVAFFGKSGAGKTLLAVQVAKIAADNGLFVGIVSTETRYGAIQRTLGKTVDESKSLKLAILDSGNIKKYATAFSENVYFYAMSDTDDIISHVVDDEVILTKFVEEIKKKFDIVFVDCTDRATDDLTAVFLKNADKIVNIIESTPDGIAFFNAHKPLREALYLRENEIIVLNKNITTNLNQATAQQLIGDKINFVITYMPSVFESRVEQTENKKFKKIMGEFYKAFLTEATVQNVLVKKKPVFKFGKQHGKAE